MATKPVQRPTPQGFTPPAHPSYYVAYHADPYRTGDAATGEAIEVRPSAYVREYPSILVKSVEHGSHGSGSDVMTFANVKFDAASAGIEGMSKDFGASVQGGSPVLALIEEAHRRQAPIYVAIETIRRAKTKGGDVIPPSAYIHDLRGAKRDGSGGEATATQNNCRNIVAAVGVAGNPGTILITGDSRTDPAEWASLRRNKDHTLPPTGWRIKDGGLAPSGATTGSGVDVDALANQVAALVASRLAPTGSAPAGAPQPTGQARPQQRATHSTEGKPWEAWNSDGRVNLSSYLAQKERFTFQAAVAMLTEHSPSTDPAALVEDAWTLTGLLLWMADTVQANVTGTRPNRAEGSHKEAARWCSLVYTDLPGATFPGLSDHATAQSWAEQVVASATTLFRRAAQQIEQHLTGDSAQPTQGGPQGTPQGGQDPTKGAQAEATTAASVPGLVAGWEGLLASVGQAEHPERFAPLLVETFGAQVLSQIDAAAFQERLNAWKGDAAAFSQSAYEAHTRAMKAGAPQ